jgi:hypothetical protein
MDRSERDFYHYAVDRLDTWLNAPRQAAAQAQG